MNLKRVRVVLLVFVFFLVGSANGDEKHLEKENTKNNPTPVISVEQQRLINRLVDAARRDNKQKVIDALAAGANVNGFDNDNESALMISASQGNLDISRLLIEKGANIELKNTEGQDAMGFAVIYDHLEIVKLFIKKGVNVSTDNHRNKYYLSCAVYNKTPAVLNLLMANGLKVDKDYRENYNETLLHAPAERCRVEIMKILIKEGVPIDIYEELEGRTPLILAAWKGCEDGVRLLVENGANVNAEDKRGRTPLIYAAYKGKLKSVVLLLEHGADLNHKTNDGETALDMAIEGEQYFGSTEFKEVINLLKTKMKK